jgi:hypothetical protein
MISVTQGPKNNAALAALDYNKTFEAGREGVRAIAGAKEAENQRINTAFDTMQSDFKQAQLTASKVAAAITQNKLLFEGLENGSNLASKSYNKFISGNYSTQDVNNLNAYIDAANAQQKEAANSKAISVNKNVAIALTKIQSDAYSGKTEKEIDAMTPNSYRTIAQPTIDSISDPEVKLKVIEKVKQAASGITAADEVAAIQDRAAKLKEYKEIQKALEENDYKGAVAMLLATDKGRDMYFIDEGGFLGERARTMDELKELFRVGVYATDPNNPFIPSNPNIESVVIK